MGRPRKRDTGLPIGVFYRHGSYFYVRKNIWTRIGRTEEAMREFMSKVDRTCDPFTPKARIMEILHKALVVARPRHEKKTSEPFVTKADLEAKLDAQQWRCAVSGIRFTEEIHGGRRPYMPSLDRLDNSKGYTVNNVRVVCFAVNIAMNVWGEEVFRNVARKAKALDNRLKAKTQIVDSETV